MKRAWISGALAVFLAHFAWLGLIVVEARVDVLMPFVVVMLFVVMNVAGLGAFITARRAPKWRLALALSMAPLTAVLTTLSNLLLQLFGVPVDLSGFYNNVGLFDVSLLYGLFVSAVGAGIALWLGRKRVEEIAPVAAAPVIAQAVPAMSSVPAEIKADLPQIRSD